ncbi:MAG TPA: acetyl-CoA hydrolase/transferase C-terminal domain-containing protein [Bacteroidia bacterium]|nr:acetyl-CoA hydrolase/transferase C-terminal domain-containing protein [Bacteroidia bacterium]HNS12598.1 acetyl-CoA hydrolase/transferase C-terminal domain-containing protein [Bacteroidia bacterium]
MSGIQIKYSTAKEALSVIQSNQRVFVHGSAATPTFLINELTKRAADLKNVELVCISVLGEFPPAKPELSSSFFINSLFVSKPIRTAVSEGHADYVPVFLSEIPDLFRNDVLTLDVAIVHVSTPDAHGYCSLGVSVDIARAAVNNAKHVIAQVNPQMPRTHGDGMIHISSFDAMVKVDEPLYELAYSGKMNEASDVIGKYISELVDDRSTIQMGIGSIPDSVLKFLGSHKDLGVHTEMFSDGIIPLIENGVITNKYKNEYRGRSVTGFCLGSRKLYDFVNDNPAFAFLDIDYVNEISVIRKNPKMHAINSCIEIDLTGQVCSDSIGIKQYSGVGGQMDFMRGAALSEGGKAIIGMPSRTKDGQSRIVSYLKEGAGVVSTRAHVHYVVTEYGYVNLFGKNLRQRAHALISIAHPDDREMLEKEAGERWKKFSG